MGDEKVVSSMEPQCHGKECHGKVLESDTLCECQNYPNPCPGYAKIPVVLGEFTVQIDVESKIRLGEKAFEIKRIKKNVYLTQCRLIAGTNKLFLKGYVRKNIEYATKDGTYKNAICGNIKQTTFFVPFHCITKVDFKKYPIFHKNHPNYEVNYYENQGETHGCDNKEKDFITMEYFNEKVYCELEKAWIYEADIVEDCDYEKIDCHCNSTEILFDTFTEKEVIYITLKLLQNQQIHYPPMDGHHCDCSKDDDKDLIRVEYR